MLCFLSNSANAQEQIKTLSVGSGEINIDYYYSYGCEDCLKYSETLFQMAKKDLITLNLYNISAEDQLGSLLEYVLIDYYKDNIVEFEALHRNLLRNDGKTILKRLSKVDTLAYTHFKKTYKSINWEQRNILISILIDELNIEKTPFLIKK